MRSDFDFEINFFLINSFDAKAIELFRHAAARGRRGRPKRAAAAGKHVVIKAQLSESDSN